MRFLIPLLLLATFAKAQTHTRTTRTFDGSVNDKYPVSLTLTTDDNLAYGTLVYKRSGIPIRVVGSLQGGNLTLHEFDKGSGVTGVFSGQASARGYLGQWFAPKINAKEMPFSLTQTSQQPAPSRTVGVLTGTYAFNFGKESAAGELLVHQIGTDRVTIAFDANRGAPSFNLATIDKTTLKLRGNQAVYSTKEFGRCTIRLTFFEGGVSVVYVGEDYDCGFGNGASVSGNYVKTSSKVPVFPKVE
jgi:hypothetical protein